MKQIILIIISFSIFSCSDYSTENELIFSGSINNKTSDTLSIYNSNYDLLINIPLENKKFNDTLNIKRGYYYLSYDEVEIQIYLESSFDLSLYFDYEEIEKSLKFSGIGSSENNYLFKKILKEDELGEKIYPGHYGKLEESSFLKLTDSVDIIYNDLFEAYKKDFSAEFKYLEQNTIKFGKLSKIADYQVTHSLLSKQKDFQVSNTFPNPFKDINLSNEKLFIEPNYIKFIERYIVTNLTKKPNKDYVLEYIENLDKYVDSPIIKEQLAYQYGKMNMQYTGKLDNVYNLINSYMLNSNYINEMNILYNDIKKTIVGSTFPNLSFIDIDGKAIMINDLKGKLIYIDFWATWCSPCIDEIPNLKKLQVKYANDDIHFVSICMNDTKESWNSFLNKNKLTGIQLFANEYNTKLLEKRYSINSLPRFILLDKESKILDSNAKRPSDENIELEIKHLL